MNNQNLIIYQLTSLSLILKELEKDLNFQIVEVLNEQSLDSIIRSSKKYLVITKNINLNIKNQFIINKFPIKIFRLIEKINIEFLRLYFNENSKFKVRDYIIDLNSREIFTDNLRLKLTEKEVDTIIYLSKAKKPVSIDELQTKVWDYNSEIETHTVETHIYRLRKKFFKSFNDNYFIISNNSGYQIK